MLMQKENWHNGIWPKALFDVPQIIIHWAAVCVVALSWLFGAAIISLFLPIVNAFIYLFSLFFGLNGWLNAILNA